MADNLNTTNLSRRTALAGGFTGAAGLIAGGAGAAFAETDKTDWLALWRQCLEANDRYDDAYFALEDAEATLFVIAANHARIARSVEAYSRVSWQIDQAGAVLNIASIPLVAYEAIAGLSLGHYADRRPRSPSVRPHPRRKEQPPTNQEG